MAAAPATAAIGMQLVLTRNSVPLACGGARAFTRSRLDWSDRYRPIGEAVQAPLPLSRDRRRGSCAR